MSMSTSVPLQNVCRQRSEANVGSSEQAHNDKVRLTCPHCYSSWFCPRSKLLEEQGELAGAEAGETTAAPFSPPRRRMSVRRQLPTVKVCKMCDLFSGAQTPQQVAPEQFRSEEELRAEEEARHLAANALAFQQGGGRFFPDDEVSALWTAFDDPRAHHDEDRRSFQELQGAEGWQQRRRRGRCMRFVRDVIAPTYSEWLVEWDDGRCETVKPRFLRLEFRPMLDFVGLLPEEVVLHVLSFLPARDLARLCTVSRHWHRAAQTDRLWRRFIVERMTIYILGERDDDVLLDAAWRPEYLQALGADAYCTGTRVGDEDEEETIVRGFLADMGAHRGMNKAAQLSWRKLVILKKTKCCVQCGSLVDLEEIEGNRPKTRWQELMCENSNDDASTSIAGTLKAMRRKLSGVETALMKRQLQFKRKANTVYCMECVPGGIWR